MKRFAFLTISVNAFAIGSALAGGYASPVVETQPLSVFQNPPRTFSWTGPYAGVYLGKSSIDLETSGQVNHDAVTVDHPAITEEVPAEVIEHPAVVEERVVEVIEHPALTETTPDRVIDHPAVTDMVQVGIEMVLTGTETVLVREDVYYDENGVKQEDENHHTGWRHVPVYEDRAVYVEQPVFEERILREAYVEIIPGETTVLREAWTETVTEEVVVQEARTEIVRPARTVIVRDAWTEVVREAFTEQLSEDFSRNGNAYGIFAGYRHQWRNNVTLGVEAHYGNSKVNSFSFDGDTVDFGSKTYGVEVQAGYAVNRALPYVAAGYSNVLDQDAVTLSIGLDYAVTDRLLIGTKYSRHDLGKFTSAGRSIEGKGDTVNLRAAIKF